MSLDRARLKREIEADLRRAARERLKLLGEQIAAARRERRERLVRIQSACRQARLDLRSKCSTERERARHEAATRIEAGHEGKRDVLRERRIARDVARMDAGKLAKQKRSRRVEQQGESDDEVRSNLPPELEAVFTLVARRIKGSARISRTEAFLHWAEENPDVVAEAQQHRADQELAALIAEYRTQEKRSGRRGRIPF